MPRGRPRKQAQEKGSQDTAQTAANGQAAGTRLNKMACVRQALAKLGNGARAKDIQGFLKQQFGLDMNSNMISAYRSSILKKAAGQSGLIPRPGSGAATTVRRATPADEGISLDDLRAIKELADRLGVEQVRALAGVFAR
jgi:hypothetical protein